MKIAVTGGGKHALETLVSQINNVCPGNEIYRNENNDEFLNHTEISDCDIAFLDIDIPETNSIAIAKKIKSINPNCNIIFVTSDSKYALEAMELHASGYILKPVTSEKISNEISDLRYPVTPCKLLNAICFGNFEVYLVDGTPIRFKRAKSKELFAYLIYRQGCSCAIRELAARIFEDETYDKKQQVYMQKIISSMMKTLKEYNIEKTITKTYNSLSVNTEYIDCDYYTFMNNEDFFPKNYTGEFMAQYSWAEFVNGYLERFIQEKF